LYNWFNCLYFMPRNNLLPELIRKDGSKTPLSQIKEIEGLMDLVNESFLKKHPEPTIIYNGTHTIPNLDRLFLSPIHNEILKTQKINFYFFEVLTHYIPNNHGRLEPHILRYDNQVELTETIRCYELDSLDSWAKKHNIDLHVHCTDHLSWKHYSKIYKNIKFKSTDLFVSWFSSRFLMQEDYNRAGMEPGDIYPVINPKKISQKFFSGAWRYDPTRHFMTAFLAANDITKTNNVSFYHKLSNEDMVNNMWFDWNTFKEKHPNMSKMLLDGNTKLQEQVPLHFEVRHPKACNITQPDPDYNTSGMVNRRRTQDPERIYTKSFCAIVNETRVTQPWSNISEKTLNALKAFRPIVMVGAPGTLSYLQELGFKTFGDYWPEEYDSILCTSDRLVAVCDTINYINNFSIDELRKMYRSMIPILEHNYNRVQTVSEWFTDYNAKLDEQILLAQ